MLHILLLLTLTSGMLNSAANSSSQSLALNNFCPQKSTVRTACEPLLSTACCPLVFAGLTGSLMPVTESLGFNPSSMRAALTGSHLISLCLAPHLALLSADCLFGKKTTGLTEGSKSVQKYPYCRATCKAATTAACIPLILAAASSCSPVKELFELPASALGCDKDGSILCLGLETFCAATYAGHYTTDCCFDNAVQTYPCCNQLDCYCNVVQEQKRD